MSAVVLVFDEELNLRLSIAQILREAGYVVVVAEKICEAHEILANLQLDLVFLNLKSYLPAEQAFLNEIRELYPQLPLLVLNTYEPFEKSRLGKSTAETRVMVKPVDPPAILEALDSLLGHNN